MRASTALWLSGATAALVGGATSPATAQSPDGRFKLGIETAVFEYSTTEAKPNGAATTTNNSTDEVTFGVAPARSGVDLAYGLGDTIVLGTRLLLIHSSTELPAGAGMAPQDVDTTVLGIVPHLDYVFPSRGTTRVFLGPMVGFGIADLGLGPMVDGSAHLFIFGGSFGAHVFAARGVSVDPRLAISYAFGEESSTVSVAPLAAETTADLHVIAVSVMLGVSAWL